MTGNFALRSRLSVLILLVLAAGLNSGCLSAAGTQSDQTEQIQFEQPTLLEADVDKTVEVNKVTFEPRENVLRAIE